MQRNHLRMAKIVNEVGLSRTQKYPNYSVTMSWDRDCCVYRTVIIWNLEQSLIFRENKAIVHSHDLQAKDFAVRDMRKV